MGVGDKGVFGMRRETKNEIRCENCAGANLKYRCERCAGSGIDPEKAARKISELEEKNLPKQTSGEEDKDFEPN